MSKQADDARPRQLADNLGLSGEALTQALIVIGIVAEAEATPGVIIGRNVRRRPWLFRRSFGGRHETLA